jgi:predicted nucleotidyltransferase component of viral defense system
MINKQQHEIVLRRLLFDLFSHPQLCSQIALKGGTCLYLFHGLDRFSTDLDFNLLESNLDAELITQVLEKYLIIKDYEQKRNTYFWLGNFEKGLHNIKVEIGYREYPDKYEHKDMLGLTLKTMTLPYMFAHKLCAITDRKQMVNRDIYDAWFLIKKNTKVAEEIIKIRTGKSLNEYLLHLAEFITQNISPQGILQGLGEVLNDQQKKWAKENLVKELLFEFKNLAVR